MALESIEVSTVLPATAERIYRAWLDSAEHSAFTGGQATVDPTVGGRHTAWDGYIEGVNLELEHGKRIVQSWRSEDFPDEADDSRVEVRFEPADSGTRVIIVHSDIPEGQGDDYKRGWLDHYFAPMAQYFGLSSGQPQAQPRPDDAALWESAPATEKHDPSAWEEEVTPAPRSAMIVVEETIIEEEEAPKPKAKPAAKAKPKAKAKAKPAAKAKPKAKPKAKAKAAAKAKPAVKAKAKAKAKPAKPKAKAAKAKAKPAAKKKPAKKKR